MGLSYKQLEQLVGEYDAAGRVSIILCRYHENREKSGLHVNGAFLNDATDLNKHIVQADKNDQTIIYVHAPVLYYVA